MERVSQWRIVIDFFASLFIEFNWLSLFSEIILKIIRLGDWYLLVLFNPSQQGEVFIFYIFFTPVHTRTYIYIYKLS